jgi:hypothetical protein
MYTLSCHCAFYKGIWDKGLELLAFLTSTLECGSHVQQTAELSTTKQTLNVTTASLDILGQLKSFLLARTQQQTTLTAIPMMLSWHLQTVKTTSKYTSIHTVYTVKNNYFCLITMSQQMGLMIYVLSNHSCATTFYNAVLCNSAPWGILILLKWHSDMIQQQLWWQPSILTTK